MASQSRKHRGYATQRIFADYIRGLFPFAEPTGAGRQGRDILSTPGIYFELKARAGFKPTEALKQTVAPALEAGDLPIIIMRMNGQGEKNVGKWAVLTEVDVMLKLLEEAGYGNVRQSA